MRAKRWLLGIFGSFFAGLTLVVLVAAPASAHAVLKSTTPATGQTVALSPKQLDLVFTENVSISPTSIQLFDEKGARVDIGAPRHSPTTDSEVQADVSHLGNGAYVVTWQVISADSHPVHGAFTFAVGRSSANVNALAAKLEAAQAGNKTVGVLFAIARAASYAGIALLLGGVVFAAAIRPRGRRRSRADKLVWIGWGLLFVSTIASVMLQGPYASSLPLLNAFHWNDIRAVLDTRYGHYAEIRIVLLLLALPLLLMVRKTWRPPSWWWAPIAVIGVAIAATPGLAGHAATGIWTNLGVPLDTVHVLSMALWLGGLACLAFIVLDRDPDARRTAERFSPLAATSVALIVISGVFAAWRQVGWSRDAFTDTTFGRLLLVKIAFFIGLLALAAWSRSIVRRRRPATLSAAVAIDTATTPAGQTVPADPEVRNLRWSVAGELVFGIAVLVVTSMLVNSQPARSVLALPFSTEMRGTNASGQTDMLVDVSIEPAQAGPVVLHIYTLTPSGANSYIQNATAQISLPSKGIAPITIPLERGGPNHFRNTNFTIPFSGKWLLVVRAFKTQIDETAVQTTVNIR
jgi:copper transport protein